MLIRRNYIKAKIKLLQKKNVWKTEKYMIVQIVYISAQITKWHADSSSNASRAKHKMTHSSWELAIYLVISKSYICLMKAQPKEGHPQERRAGLGFL